MNKENYLMRQIVWKMYKSTQKY